MPPVATLKNAYRDRKPRKGQGGQESGDEEQVEERKKVPQSFTFMRREGHCFQQLVVFISENISKRPSIFEYSLFSLNACNIP